MVRRVLGKLGFSDNEIKVYLTILSLEQAPISIISKKSWLKRTTNYAIVEKLVKDGVISSLLRNNISYYCALDPELLVEKFKQKMNEERSAIIELENMIPILWNFKWILGNKPDLHKFEWMEGLKSMCNDLFWEKWIVKSFVQIDDFPREAFEYLQKEYYPRRVPEMNIESKAIILEKWEYAKFANYIKSHPWTTKIISPSEIDIKASFQVYRNKVAFYTTKKNLLHWIIIESEFINTTFDEIFNFIWRKI